MPDHKGNAKFKRQSQTSNDVQRINKRIELCRKKLITEFITTKQNQESQSITKIQGGEDFEFLTHVNISKEESKSELSNNNPPPNTLQDQKDKLVSEKEILPGLNSLKNINKFTPKSQENILKLSNERSLSSKSKLMIDSRINTITKSGKYLDTKEQLKEVYNRNGASAYTMPIRFPIRKMNDEAKFECYFV